MPSKDSTSKCQSNAVTISLICGIPLGNVLGPSIFKQIKGLHVVDYKNKLASVVRMCVGWKTLRSVSERRRIQRKSEV